VPHKLPCFVGVLLKVLDEALTFDELLGLHVCNVVMGVTCITVKAPSMKLVIMNNAYKNENNGYKHEMRINKQIARIKMETKLIKIGIAEQYELLP
jgi:hypothetical protein